MNRQQFAECVAQAYVDQFSTDGHRVMNECIIVWDGDNFGSQSSLTPVFDAEAVVMSLEEGMFGDVDADDPDAEASIVNYLVDFASNHIWTDVTTAIEDAELE